MEPTIPGYITQARESAQALGKSAAEYVSQQPTIERSLKEAVQRAYDYSSDIIGPLDEKIQSYYQAPKVAREKYLTPDSPSYVSNPFTAERLVSEYTGQEALPVLSLSSILGQRFGRYQDLIGSGVDAFNAELAARQADYEMARQGYSDLLSEYQILENLKEQQRQYELDRRALELREAGSGGGGGGGGFGFGGVPTDWEIVTPEEVVSGPSARIIESGPSARIIEDSPTVEAPQEEPNYSYELPGALRALSSLGNAINTYQTIAGIPQRISNAGSGILGAYNTARNIARIPLW